MSGPQAAALERERVLAVLFDLFPWARAYRSGPVRAYAAALYEVKTDVSCPVRAHARRAVCKWVSRTARAQGLSRTNAARLAAEIEAFPVLQTGPHLHLLIEPDAFFTHLFSMMGLRSRDAGGYLSYACSTVKFTERSRKGPGWLMLDGQPVNVFGLSRREMIPYSILAERGPCQFRLRPAEGTWQSADAIDELWQVLPRIEFSSAATAIKSANQNLWQRYFDRRLPFLQLDDCDVAGLVIAHLEDPGSWLTSTFLADPKLPVIMLRAIDRLASTPWRGWLRNATHFFWGNDDGGLYPLLLDDGILRPADDQGEGIAFTAEALTKALAAKRIIPNLFLVFMVIAILPGIRVLGGSRHAVYYPLMRYAFCAALVDTGADDELLRSLLHDKRPGAWGHRVIDGAAEPFALVRGKTSNLELLLSRYGSTPLERACGSLDSFTQDALWTELALALASGTASTMRGAWAFA